MKRIFNFKTLSAIGMLLLSNLSYAGEKINTDIERPIYEELGTTPTILFIVMMSITTILIMALVSVTKSTAHAFKFKHDKVKKAGLLILLGFFSSNSFAAINIVDSSDYLINFSDNAFWAFLIFDIVLVMLILYFTGLTKGALTEFKADEVPDSVFATWNKKLTNAVEIKDEGSILLDHDYDGIRELDNDLPPWWKYGFIITVIWGLLYYPYYHFFNTDGLQEAEFEIAMAEAKLEVAAYKIANPNLVNEDNVELLSDAASIANGKKVFEKNCVACHKADGGGAIGPNLTDDTWVYGGDIKGVFHTIAEGTNSGMAVWKDFISMTEIQEVSSYVLQLELAVGGQPAKGENVIPK